MGGFLTPLANKGYSLVESLVAGVLLASIVVGVFAIMGQGTKLSKNNLVQRKAYMELERILESRRFSSEWYDYLGAASDTTHSLDSVILEDSLVAGAKKLKGKPTVRVQKVNYRVGAINQVPAKMLTAKLQWRREGLADSCVLQTVITKVDIN